MQSRNLSRNPMGFTPASNATFTKTKDKSILLPWVASTTNKKIKSSYGKIKSPYERSALTPPNRSRGAYSEKQRPSSNKAASASLSNLVKKQILSK